MNIAIIFAAGVGSRIDDSRYNTPKQFIKIKDKPILIHTLENFEKHTKIDKIYLAVSSEYLEYANKLIKEFNITKVQSVISGGFCAMETIYILLNEIYKKNPKDSIVLIHDGVRPILDSKVIDENIESAKLHGNAITVVKANETVLISKENSTLNVPLRSETFVAQAPQSFVLEDILKAHNEIRKINKNYNDIVDNCTLYTMLSKKVYLVNGNYGNIKVTTTKDLYTLNGILDYMEHKKGSEFV